MKKDIEEWSRRGVGQDKRGGTSALNGWGEVGGVKRPHELEGDF